MERIRDDDDDIMLELFVKMNSDVGYVTSSRTALSLESSKL